MGCWGQIILPGIRDVYVLLHFCSFSVCEYFGTIDVQCFTEAAKYLVYGTITPLKIVHRDLTIGDFPPFGLTNVTSNPASVRTLYGCATSGRYHPFLFPVFPSWSWLVNTQIIFPDDIL